MLLQPVKINKAIKNIYPWFVFVLASSFLFYKYLLQVSPSVMVTPLMTSFHLTGTALGHLAAFYFYAYLCMQLPAGLLLDYFIPKRLVAAAVLICAIGALFFSQANTLFLAALGRLLIGIGGAFSAVGAMKIITLWFPPQRFALVSGLMMTVGMLGAIAGEAVLSYSVAHLGWRMATLYCAGLGGILSIAIGLMIVHRQNVHRKPMTTVNFHSNLLNIIKDKQSWFLSIYSGLAFAPISAFSGLWGVPYLTQYTHFNHLLISGLVSLTFAGFAMGSPLAGWLSDQIQRRKPLMIAGTSLGMLSLMLLIYHPPLNRYALGALLFFFGFFTSFFFVSFAHMKEIHHPQASGTAIGFMNTFNAIGGAFSEPLIGKLLDLGWDHTISHGVHIFSVTDYQQALIVLPLLMLIALGLQLGIKESFCQSQYSLEKRLTKRSLIL